MSRSLARLLVAPLAGGAFVAARLAVSPAYASASPAAPTNVVIHATATRRWMLRPEQYAETVTTKDLAIPMSRRGEGARRPDPASGR